MGIFATAHRDLSSCAAVQLRGNIRVNHKSFCNSSLLRALILKTTAEENLSICVDKLLKMESVVENGISIFKPSSLKKGYIDTYPLFCLFLFYLPYLSSIHEKANCIAILWTVSPHSLGSCLFRGIWVTCLPPKGGASR